MSSHSFIAAFIKNQRDLLDLTQEELANLADVDKKWIKDIETNSHNSRGVENFIRLMAVFGMIQNDQQGEEKLDWAHLPQLTTVFSQLLMLDPISVQMFVTLFPEYRRMAIRLKDAP